MARLLIVDDEEAVRRTLRRVLERDSHQVEEARSVSEARDALLREHFDLVLCDVRLDGESGLALLRDVCEDLPTTGIVMVTGVDDPEVAREAIRLGAYGYLVKPFLPNEVLINVSSGLRHRDLEVANRNHVAELEVKLLDRATALRSALKSLDEAATGAERAEEFTVDRLVAALTLRSEETGAHIERMSRYASSLATASGITYWSPDEFRVAAMLHDLGKIGVPDSILLKPSSLTADEEAAIRRHPGLGAGLLDGPTRVMRLASSIALSHHERWDGAGYPAGSRGEDIPIEGRVAAIADVFDALTSDRVYRPAMAVDQAVAIMHAQRARHFDPDLLDLFEGELDAMLRIRFDHPDLLPPSSDVVVLVVEPRRMFADALARELGRADGISVGGVCGSAREAEAHLARHRVTLVVAANDLPDASGLDLTRRIALEHPTTSTIVMSNDDDDALLLKVLDLGGAGVVRRDRAFDDLIDAVGAVRAGRQTVSAVRINALRRKLTSPAVARLSEREIEVLRLMADGLTNESIATQLIISLNTVRNHVQRILSKLSAHSKLEAVAEARRRGLLSADR